MNIRSITLGVFRRELKRRNVIRACVVYVISCWGVLQAGEIAATSLGFDTAVASRLMLAIAISGFPLAVIFAWFYQVSASGIARTPPFIERRILNNIALLGERRNESPQRGGPSRHETTYDWILEIESGPLSGKRYGLDGDVVVGRSTECDLTIPVPHISRKHARFILDGSRLLIEDLGSSNGTAVNGKRIGTTAYLNQQDKVEILDVIIRIKESLTHSHTQDSTILHDPTIERPMESGENKLVT